MIKLLLEHLKMVTKFLYKKQIKKLQDIFVNEKIPKFARHFIPLLLVGNEIIKIPFISAKSVKELTTNKGKLIGIKVTSDLLNKII
ncbi:hypothetical protein CM15mP43_02860 [bacterium]|nr:MAG: hypothetical protein CM15mP43_02860 [bacterium]